MLSHELTKWVNCFSTKNLPRLNSTDLLTQFVIGLSHLEILTSTNLGSIFLLVCYSFQGCIWRLKSRFPWKISKHAEDMAPNSGIFFDFVRLWTFHSCLHLIQKKLTFAISFSVQPLKMVNCSFVFSFNQSLAGENSVIQQKVSRKMSLIIGARRHLEWGHEKYIMDIIQSHPAQVKYLF